MSFFPFQQKKDKLTQDQGTHLYDVVKTNASGKKQRRQLSLSEDGVRNCDSGNVQWFVAKDRIVSLKRDSPNSSEFTLSIITDYKFQGSSLQSVDQMFKLFDELQLNKGSSYNESFNIDAQGSEPSPPTEQMGNEEQGQANEDGDFELIDAHDKKPAPKPTQKPTAPSVPPIVKAEKPKPVEPPMSRLDVPLGLSLAASANTVCASDFQILALIGKGSFGKVFQVKKKSDDRIYAMKVLRKYELYQRNQNFHTLTERTILATIHHSFMPTLYYTFQTPYKLYLIIDYANGGEMFFHLRRAGSFPEILATFYIAEICLVLAHLHKNNIVYRDLKPENVLIDSEGHILLTDYGLSKIGVTAVGGYDSEGFTTKTFCGTPEYLAPEILRGIPHGKAVDWWSVGILYYEMLCGTPPFYSQNRNLMYQNTLNGTVTFPDAITPHQRDFISSLLKRAPEERLGSSPTGASDVLSHPVFTGIDMEKLEKREIPPPFKPRLEGGLRDTTNIDPEFLAEPAVDSPPVSPAGLTPDVMDAINADFVGFDFNYEIVRT
ncbi:putative protein kinase [Blattamonas nauphoetae]|uniref:Non-specific serine/threonine protein kinase n=1 Tax=Blattamonas nauphoetae TaxID=2049346 RepID=A0ABQ9XWK4_9EUKA|nr:putative protein kinase [Blattamonas nauphoetae]